MRFRGVDGFLVHPARVEIPDLLQVRFRGFLRVRFPSHFGSKRCGFLGDDLQRVIILLRQHVEAAPARELRRNRVPFYPAAVRVKIKVLRRFHRRIDIFQVERRRVLIRRSSD